VSGSHPQPGDAGRGHPPPASQHSSGSNPRTRGKLEQRSERSYVARRVSLPIQSFISTEVFSGAVLLLAAVVAITWANSPWDESYSDLIHETFELKFFGVVHIEEDLQHWVNDGLMTLFFFVVGLEIKRELFRGELRGVDKAALPGLAAVGGMLAPALIYTALNAGGAGEAGWGIPMATDIAFALGILAVIGSRIPPQLRIFLLALAIADDIGAILVIAVFYTDQIALDSLAVAALLLALIYAMNRLGVQDTLPYLLVGLCVWAAVFESGVHATIAGVALGLMTPVHPYYGRGKFLPTISELLDRFRHARQEDDTEMAEQIFGQMEDVIEGSEAPVDRLERTLHPFTSFVVVPLFALANAGVPLHGDIISDSLHSSVTLGIIIGLLVGKPIGILLASWLAVRTGIARLPHNVTWPQMLGVGILAGVGFTVSLFINELAFSSQEPIDQGKIGILAASVAAGVLGMTTLLAIGRRAALQPGAHRD